MGGRGFRGQASSGLDRSGPGGEARWGGLGGSRGNRGVLFRFFPDPTQSLGQRGAPARGPGASQTNGGPTGPEFPFSPGGGLAVILGGGGRGGGGGTQAGAFFRGPSAATPRGRPKIRLLFAGRGKSGALFGWGPGAPKKNARARGPTGGPSHRSGGAGGAAFNFIFYGGRIGSGGGVGGRGGGEKVLSRGILFPGRGAPFFPRGGPGGRGERYEKKKAGDGNETNFSGGAFPQ